MVDRSSEVSPTTDSSTRSKSMLSRFFSVREFRCRRTRRAVSNYRSQIIESTKQASCRWSMRSRRNLRRIDLRFAWSVRLRSSGLGFGVSDPSGLAPTEELDSKRGEPAAPSQPLGRLRRLAETMVRPTGQTPAAEHQFLRPATPLLLFPVPDQNECRPIIRVLPISRHPG